MAFDKATHMKSAITHECPGYDIKSSDGEAPALEL